MVNLEHYVGQEVLVTLKNGHTDFYKVERYIGNLLYYMIGQLPYTIDGVYCPNPDFDIIKIEPMNKITQLKKQIQELQAELKRLENENKIPDGFDAERAYKFLSGDCDDGLDALFWGKNTQEGEKYWFDISVDNKNPTDKDVIQLQKWIIESYRKQLGLYSS